MIEGTEVPEYEPYKEIVEEILLEEPLRCADNVCDYIDYRSGKIVRNVKVEKNGILKELEESISSNIELPKIQINNGVSNIFVETDIIPTEVIVDYYN
jgi:hypothetical protein